MSRMSDFQHTEVGAGAEKEGETSCLLFWRIVVVQGGNDFLYPALGEAVC